MPIGGAALCRITSVRNRFASVPLDQERMDRCAPESSLHRSNLFELLVGTDYAACDRSRASTEPRLLVQSYREWHGRSSFCYTSSKLTCHDLGSQSRRFIRLFDNGRGDRIRTYDPLVPNQMRYQAALLPDWPWPLGLLRFGRKQKPLCGQVAPHAGTTGHRDVEGVQGLNRQQPSRFNGNAPRSDRIANRGILARMTHVGQLWHTRTSSGLDVQSRTPSSWGRSFGPRLSR